MLDGTRTKTRQSAEEIPGGEKVKNEVLIRLMVVHKTIRRLGWCIPDYWHTLK